MKRVLVTGGAGFIGSNLVSTLLDSKCEEIFVIDDLSTGKHVNIKQYMNKITFIQEDIRNLSLLQEICNKVEVVFHLAALPSVPRSIADPISTNAVNIEGTLNILMAARNAQVRRVVYSSSSSVYGDTLELPKVETAPVNPLSPYALSKYTGERYAQLFSKIFGLDTVCLRYFNVFGPRQDPTSQYAAVIPKFISSILSNRPITVYGDGEQTRDFTYISNVVHANLLAAIADEGVGEVFNIACGEQITINQLAEYLFKICGQRVDIIFEEGREGEVRDSLADISKAKDRLLYQPRVDVYEGLKKTADWFHKQTNT